MSINGLLSLLDVTLRDVFAFWKFCLLVCCLSLVCFVFLVSFLIASVPSYQMIFDLISCRVSVVVMLDCHLIHAFDVSCVCVSVRCMCICVRVRSFDKGSHQLANGSISL